MSASFFKKTVLFNGDSIAAGLPKTGSWATRIAEQHGAACFNYARGGGTVTENPPPLRGGTPRHSVSSSLERMKSEHPHADYVILEGGTNDADLLSSEDGVGTRFGKFDAYDFSGNYDRDTFTGALDSLFYRALRLWDGVRIGFIVAQKMGRDRASLLRRRLYMDRAVSVCRKWGVPCLDLWEECILNPLLPNMYDPTKSADENLAENTGYYIDGQHLTARGYDLTAEKICHWMETL